MAHELPIENGRASMFYVDEEPWHGLGKKLDKPATAAEAIEAANLAWEVERKPLYAGEGSSKVLVPDRFAVVRRDLWGKPDCPVLGVVGGDYTPVQNREAFEFFDPIAGKGAAIYDTAGALGKGERVWILGKLPSDIRVIGEDITDKYLLLSNSHDGRSSVQVKFTPIRVVCNNTLTLALSQDPTVRITHTRDVRQRLREVERTLGIIHNKYDQIEEVFQAMARVRMKSNWLAEYLKPVFPDPPDSEDEKRFKRAQLHREWAEYFLLNGRGNKEQGIAGTLWAAYNGVTEYIDHRRTAQSPDRRLNSIWFGGGYRVKAQAFNVAKSKMGAWLN